MPRSSAALIAIAALALLSAGTSAASPDWDFATRFGVTSTRLKAPGHAEGALYVAALRRVAPRGARWLRGGTYGGWVGLPAQAVLDSPRKPLATLYAGATVSLAGISADDGGVTAVLQARLLQESTAQSSLGDGSQQRRT